MSQNRYSFKIRVGVVVFNAHGNLLLVRQNQNPFWVLPGGTLEPGETMADCAVRELQEEANLVVSDPKLLFIADFLVDPTQTPPKQAVDVVFKVKLDSDPSAMVMETTENIDEMAFFGLADVIGLSEKGLLKPTLVFERLLTHWQAKFWPQDGLASAYLGAYAR
ncbi:MAG: NUDIX hydrolase [Cyanobacteria bacterium HKST-UBA04]|nr:NUDIX hydrolase [Cyanobacteria bacterium HKST-UBA04]